MEIPNGNSCSEPQGQFVQLLTAEQDSLLRYIATLLGDVNDANNVLQQTNIVLWRKADDFEAGTSFRAWARKVAYFQTLAFIRDQKRDKLVFDEVLVQQLATEQKIEDEDERQIALRRCLEELPENSLDILRMRYAPGGSIRSIALKHKMNEGAVKMSLVRIRRSLVQCIESKLEGA